MIILLNIPVVNKHEAEYSERETIDTKLAGRTNFSCFFVLMIRIHTDDL